MKRWLLIFLVFHLSSTSWAQPQKYEVDFSHTPLNEVLIQLKEQFNWQYSFDDRLLSRYKISIKGIFTGKQALMDTLLKGLPLGYEIHNDVLIIYQARKKPTPWQFTGQVMAFGTGESLPFSHVMINGYGTTTDFKGAFSYSSPTDSVFHLRVSHLGCFILDTLISAGLNHRIALKPASIALPEIIVKNYLIEKAAQTGELPGLLTINTYIAQYLPGNGDNSVFNLMRLQPGILAAGEQNSHLTIWGCPEGTSRVKTDGFIIWKLNNLSDQIGAVNPFITKNIRIFKGGYDATNDDVTGGIANITAINGSTQDAGFNLFVNNQTINGMMELPIKEKSSLVLAVRQTYQNLLDASDFRRSSILNPSSGLQTYSINPNYDFHDINLKYSIQGDNSDLFYISTMVSNDELKYRYKQEWPRYQLFNNNKEENTQIGGTLFYGKSWHDGSRTGFKTSYSTLVSSLDRNRYIERDRDNKRINRIDSHEEMDVAEWSGEVEHAVPIASRHLITTGITLIGNNITIVEDTFDIRMVYWNQQTLRMAVYMQDEILLTPHTTINAGIRFNYHFDLKKAYPDPRLSIQIKPSDLLKFNLAWGLYHQYLVKSSVVDEDENYHYIWASANDNTIPVMKAMHYVGGAVYSSANFTASIEPYYKESRGMTRFFRMQQQNFLLEGKNRSYGIDFFIKQDLRQHAIWIAYSLGRTEESFYKVMDNNQLTSYLQQKYRRAPQDQRHEVKAAGVLNFKNWHFSASYVYGTGFPLYTNYLRAIYTEPDYNRIDVAITYKQMFKQLNAEIGLSILNLLDADNVKYASFIKVPLDQLNTIYINTRPVEFTPLLYLKLSY